MIFTDDVRSAAEWGRFDVNEICKMQPEEFSGLTTNSPHVTLSSLQGLEC